MVLSGPGRQELVPGGASSASGDTKSKCAAAYMALHAHTSSPSRMNLAHLPSLIHSAPGKTSSWPFGPSSGKGACGVAQYRPAGSASICFFVMRSHECTTGRATGSARGYDCVSTATAWQPHVWYLRNFRPINSCQINSAIRNMIPNLSLIVSVFGIVSWPW